MCLHRPKARLANKRTPWIRIKDGGGFLSRKENEDIVKGSFPLF